MWREFKQFVARGNVIELAIAVIIGAAFSKIVDSLVEDVIMPLVGIIVGGINLEALQFRVGGAVVLYGNFIQTMVDFLLISIAIFAVIKILNKYHAKKDDEKAEEEQEVSNIELLSEIRDILKRNEENDRRRGKREDPIIRFNRKVK
ncbi:mechanosensitive ion channel protein MscL [Lottiidibacillus patelloidae]|uniref:Large-conductance mechanosensitive channel n=1 Tax=Lottiidibacillus patelloidae TaxID=2670334 RepID=A0A263BUS6_9BACI|nr:large conductance mechanosensitive channel protein MscL [Lottiidibacillus patelloidae]OZM56926.1 mechanosensitive ion channel protein MscL [Lottiidibacillus patelloidae]